MGQKFAAFDAKGNITAFYDADDSPAPQGLTDIIEITDEQWLACISTSGHTVQNGVLVAPVPPSAAELLAQAQTKQRAVIDAAYASAVQQPVTYKTTGAITETFQADTDSQTLLMQATQGYAIAGSTPDSFYWVAADNTQVPFTLADLQGLYRLTLSQGWEAFQKRQNLKAKIDTATTIAAVQAVVWDVSAVSNTTTQVSA